jgi:uracil phosphoribosyltransferase
MKKQEEKDIVPGYKGVMDLDLSLVAKENHAVVLKQHDEDIKSYKLYQESLPEHLRYDNTVVIAEKVIATTVEAARVRQMKKYKID